MDIIAAAFCVLLLFVVPLIIDRIGIRPIVCILILFAIMVLGCRWFLFQWDIEITRIIENL